MKKFTFLTLLTAVFLFSIVMMSSCTKEGAAGTDGVDGPAGPQGIAGEAGIDGTDGTAGCILCHTGGEEQGMFAQTNQWEASVHATGGNFERNTSDCGICHTSQGFLANLAGTYDENVENPNPINCYTCHNIHKTFTPADLELTASVGVELMINGEIIDFGKGNLCAACHQPRLPDPMPVVGGGDVTISSSYWGGHHGPQTTTFAGTGLFEFSGTASLGTNAHYSYIEDGCITCHMAEADGVATGGHTFNVAEQDADGVSGDISLAGCTECHKDEDVLEADIETLQDDVHLLLAELALLLNEEGILAVGDYQPTPGTYSSDVAAAFLNWAMLEEDRSFGVHNPKYVIGILENTIAELTP
ncbi:MAG: collagen-like protein [Bacteroidetes bacterium]|nr:collagen-like protein [Bacteroidota bacterium]